MTVRSALIVVLIGCIAFACVGAMMGVTIGTLAPGYYRFALGLDDSSDINPLQVGIGLGIVQGATSGIVISLVVLGMLVWRDTCAARPKAEAGGFVKNQVPRSWSVHVIWGIATIISLVLVGTVTFVLGAIIGQQSLYQSWTGQKLDKIATILNSGDFNGVRAECSSAGQVYLKGMIEGNATRDELHQKLAAAFGVDEADQMTSDIYVVQ